MKARRLEDSEANQADRARGEAVDRERPQRAGLEVAQQVLGGEVRRHSTDDESDRHLPVDVVAGGAEQAGDLERAGREDHGRGEQEGEPGGVLMVAEPTNIAYGLVDAIALGDPPDIAAALLGFQLVCEKGKKSLGEGSNLLGESLPALLANAGLRDIDIRVNDRTSPMAPPYATPAQRHTVEELIDTTARKIWIWDETQTRRYFVAGGGAEGEFAALWSMALDQRARCIASIRDQTFVCAGGSLHYLACGRRARASSCDKTPH